MAEIDEATRAAYRDLFAAIKSPYKSGRQQRILAAAERLKELLDAKEQEKPTWWKRVFG